MPPQMPQQMPPPVGAPYQGPPPQFQPPSQPQFQPQFQAPYSAPPAAAPYVIPPRPFNHGAHIIGDLCSFGMWVPFHLLFWALHSRKATVVMPDGRRIKR